MSNNFSNIKERILYISELKKLKRQHFFEDLGVTYGNFTGKNKETPVNSNILEKILISYPDINPVWLITGKGDVLIKDEVKSSKDMFSEMIIQNNLTLLYDDNMKAIYFLTSLLNSKGYIFNKKERDKLHFFKDVGEIIHDISVGDKPATPIIIENIDHIIRIDMFRFVGDLMWRARIELNFDVVYNFDNLNTKKTKK